PWRYVDSECPRCLNVDDKLELRRLQYRQIGGLSALEDAASIGANLTNHFYFVASITHQSAGCDIAPLRVSRRCPFTRGQDGKLHMAGGEESVGTHEQSIAALACKHGKGSIDLSDGCRLEYLDLQSDDRGSFVQVPQCALGGRRIGRIDEHSNTGGLGDQFMQQPQWLRRDLHIQRGHAGNVAARSPEAGHQSSLDRVIPYLEHDWRRCRRRLGSACATTLPGIAITATGRRITSAMTAGNRPYCPSSQWYSTVTFCPSMYPLSS